MAVDLSKLLKLWKGNKAQLPSEGPEEKLFFVLDTPVIEVYQGGGEGNPLRRISNIIYTPSEITSLESISDPIQQVMYIVKKDSAYIVGTYNGESWVTLFNTIDTVTPSNSITFTNKIIDADNNTLSNIEVDNFKDGVAIAAGDNIVSNDAIGTASSSKLVTEKAFVEYIQKQFNDRINGMEFMGIKTVTEINALQSGELGNYYIISDTGVIDTINLNKDDRIIITQNFKGRSITKSDFYLIISADITKVLTPDGVQVVTNKTIDADSNIIANLEADNFKAGFMVSDISAGEGSDTNVPTTAAVKKALASITILWEDGNIGE